MLSNVITSLAHLTAMLALETPAEDPSAAPAVVEVLAADETPGESPNEESETEETVPVAVVRDVRKEAASYRTKLRTLETEMETMRAERDKEIQDAELAKLEGTERLTKERELLQTQLTEANAVNKVQVARNDRLAKESAIRDAAGKLDFHNPADAAKMINISSIGMTDGQVDEVAVQNAVQSLATSNSYLVRGLSDGKLGGPANPAPPAGQAPAPKVKLTDDARVAQMRKEAKEARERGDGMTSNRILNKVWEMQNQG